MESETDLLVPKEDNTSLDEPKDRFKFVYILMYLLGVGTLLPWNFFSNAKVYFMYKLRNTTLFNATSDFDDVDPQYETNLQTMFESYLTLAAMIPNVLFMYLNTAATHYIRLTVRIITATSIMIGMFGLAIALTITDTDEVQTLFFGITLGTIIIMNAGSAVLQGGVFGLAGLFPKVYTQAVMGGMGMGGTIAAVASIIAISIGNNPLESGFGYFMCAAVVLIMALGGFFLLPCSSFYRYYADDVRKRTLTQSVNSSTDYMTDSTDGTSMSSGPETALLPASLEPKHSSMLQVFRKIWMYAVCVFFTFFITLSCYPAINSAIHSTAQPGKWKNLYFMPVSCFLTFNSGDWLGRTLAGPLRWPREGSKLIPVLCFLRVLFIPLFLLCNVQPRKVLHVYFYHDSIPIVLMVLFAVSNGYLGTLSMMYGPRNLALIDMETGGSLMSFFLSLGLGMGSVLSIILVTIFLR